jgi:hypothetical protein
VYVAEWGYAAHNYLVFSQGRELPILLHIVHPALIF